MSINIKIDSKFSESTARNHKNRFARILKEVELNTIQNNAQKTFDKIDKMNDARSKKTAKPISDSSKLDFLTTIKALHREGILQIKKDQLQVYEQKFKILKEKRTKQVSSNRQTKAQRGRSINYDEIFKYLQKNNYDTEDVIIALYSYFPARRGDIRLLQFTTKAPTEDDKNNYIYIKGTQVILSFNDYKTQNKMGLQQFNISEPDKKLPEQMKKYMKRLAVILRTFKKSEGEYLLQNNKNNVYDQATFSRYITNLYIEKFNSNVSIDILRQSFRTYVDNKYRLNLIQQELIAQMMGHSLSQAVQYYKIDIENNSVEPSDTMNEDLTQAEELGKYVLYKLRNGKIIFKKTGK